MQGYMPKLGLQNSVCAFVDPLQTPALSHTMRRTGEGVDMPVQDGAPSRACYLSALKNFGIDFLLQHVMPGEAEHLAFIESMAQCPELGFMIANEFLNVNLFHEPHSNRGDFTAKTAAAARCSPGFLGFLYDETEHLQVHPNIYRRDPNAQTRWQWADPTGKSLDEAEDAVTAAVAEDARRLNSPLYSEHVFSILFHAFARGGMNLMPKVMKEEYQSVQLASAIGAATQYGVDFGICVDMWGTDVGPWFTRKWGFPGHSPVEFESALRMAWHFAPSLMFVENIDPLLRLNASNELVKTEFGEIYERFVREYAPAHPLTYRFSDAVADTALVRSDDGLFAAGGTFDKRAMYGSSELTIDDHHRSIFKAWHMLSHGTVPDDQIYYYGRRYASGKRHFTVTPETIKTLPLENGVPRSDGESVHGLFYPMRGVLAFDQHVGYGALKAASLIVAAGSRMTPACANAMLRCASEGATLVAAPWLMPRDCQKSRDIGSGKLIISETFSEADMLEQIRPHLGARDVWSQRFGDQRLMIKSVSKDNEQLELWTESIR